MKKLELAGLPPSAAHERLVAAGFKARRSPIPAPRARDGSPRWRSRLGATATPDPFASELLYVHADGGVVRVYQSCAPTVAFEEIFTLPFARKSVLHADAPSPGFLSEACVVTAGGRAIPRTLRHRDGLRFDENDVRASYAFAKGIFKEHCIPLESKPDPRSIPEVEEGEGALALGWTVIPSDDFWEAEGRVRKLGLRSYAAVVERRREEGPRLFFTGAKVVANATTNERCSSLASLSIHEGSNVFSIDPFGYEASVQHMLDFLRNQLPDIGEYTLLETTTGRDLTHIARRFPSRLIDMDEPVAPAHAHP